MLGSPCTLEPAAGRIRLCLGHAGARLLVALNLGPTPHRLSLPGPGRVLLSTHLDREHEPVSDHVELRGDEGLILE